MDLSIDSDSWLKRPSVTPLMWSIGTLSLICFVMAAANFGGPIPLVFYLAIWMLIGLSRPAHWLNVILANRLVWLMPIVALLSVFVSQDATFSARTALELIASTGCAIVLTRSLGERPFISCLAVALLFAAGVSVLFGGTEVITGQAGDALHGVFESKNYFALILSLGCLANLAMMLDSSQPVLFRIGGLTGVLICVPLLVAARSVDAIASAFVAVVLLMFVSGLGALPPLYRRTALSLAAMFIVGCVAIFVVIALTSNIDGVLAAVGKNSSLTGRAYLWLRAQELIVERPIFGYGYQAFWVHDFPEAEGLWRFGHVVARAGYHFHNLYYETLIELGVIGLAALVVTLLATLIATLRWTLRNPSSRSGFFLSLLVLFLVRSPLEVDALGPFGIGTFLLATIWVIANRQFRSANPVAARSPTTGLAFPAPNAQYGRV
jgi:exopolysaccharide production protein ExoQ